MTVTEAPRDVQDAAAVDIEPASPTGLAALVGSGDPRAIGNLFVGTSLLFLLVTAVTGLLVGFEQVDVEKADNILSSDTLSQVVTLHSISGLFLVVLPLLLGIATAVVPLQIGASTVAFPRASAAGYWSFLVGGGLLLASYALNGGPFGGDADGVALFIVAFVLVLVALCVATVSVVTTVVALRAPGMTLRRTPLFSWSMLVAGSIWLLTLPVLAGILVLSYVDLTWGTGFMGGANGLYSRIMWVFWQPTLYAFAIPALGIIADIVPVFAQRRHQRHAVAMFAIGLFGALSFGAWANVAVTGLFDEIDPQPTPWLYKGPWVAVSFIIVVPLLALLGLWALTLTTGKVRLGSPLLFALVAGTLLLVGVAGGVGTAIDQLDVDGTTWMTAQSYAVLLAALTAGFGALAYWGPKLYGRTLSEASTRLTATLLLAGTVVLVVPYAIAGLLDQPRLLDFNLDAIDGDVSTIETLNTVSAIGGVIVVLGLLLGILGVVGALIGRKGTSPGDDPWAGHTLEWATSSPPPVGNFASLPEITSEAPLYDARHAALRTTTEASA